MNSSSQPGVPFWRGNMGDHTDSNSRSPSLRRDISKSVPSSGVQGAVLFAGCGKKGGNFSPVVFLLNSQISFFFFSPSHLHQRASGYQQPGPCRPQVHHEVERPLAAGASGGGGAGGLSGQRHPLPTERSQAAG